MTAPLSGDEAGYLIAGGGTGGHIFPALALAEEIRKRRPEAPIVFVGTARGLETRLVPRAGYPLELIRVMGLVGKPGTALAKGLLMLPLSLYDSHRVLSRHRPKAVVGVGGYASGPVVATARLRCIPTVIHESNAVPGITNRLLSRLSSRVVVGDRAALSGLPRATHVGNPVRGEFFRIAPLDTRPKERVFSIAVVGGSQGAEILNRLVPTALVSLARTAKPPRVRVVHQCGAPRGRGLDRPDIAAAYRGLGNAGLDGVEVREFVDDMAALYESADLVVARAGSMSVAEIAASSRPAILIPFARATHGHQEANARAFERAGAALVVTEAEASAELLTRRLGELLAEPERLASMGRAARSLSREDAASRFCDEVFAAERRPIPDRRAP